MLDFRVSENSVAMPQSLHFAGATLHLGRIHADLQTFTVSANERYVRLTRLEFDLLVYLMRHAGRVVSREELTQRVFQAVYRKDSSLIRVHLSHLRKKLGIESDPIATVTGRGLVFRIAS
jgi:DNA-binding response OmpR family regulator